MTKEEVAEVLGCSTRQVERYTAAGKLGVKYEKGTTRKIPVYDRSQVEALKAELETPTFKPSIERAQDAPQTAIATRSDIGASSLSELVAIISAATVEATRAQGLLPSVPIADKLVLSLKEAALLSGISRDRLLEAIESKKLKASKDKIGRGWRVKRDDLDSYVKKL
jgi:excisionase family DNA binding protein